MKLRLSYLAVLIGFTIVATSVTGVVLTWRAAGDELRDVLEDDLANQGRLLARLLVADEIRLNEVDLDAVVRRAFQPDDEDTVWVNVYDVPTGKLISNLDHALPLKSDATGRVRLQWDGHDWEGYQRREGGVVVQLLRRTDLYTDVQEDVLEDIAGPAAVGSLVNLLLLAALTGLALWPLSRLSRALESRGPGSLAPLEIKARAEEIRVLRDTLNRLMSGVDTVLARERQFASDVAHELRTPLTTLKIELAAPDPDLAALRNEVGRLARIVEQLLTLARLEQGRWHASFTHVALDELWQANAERLTGLMSRAGMHVETDVCPAEVDGEPVLLGTLVDNLLGNVIRHCPPGTAVSVRIGTRNGRAFLTVSDSGPGVDPARLSELNRTHGQLDARGEGLGLGLAICQRIAALHGATLTFGPNDDGPGLRVQMVFGT